MRYILTSYRVCLESGIKIMDINFCLKTIINMTFYIYLFIYLFANWKFRISRTKGILRGRCLG